ncbi:Uncharacterised protein [Paenibacillus polymyxa]|uniref:hypothetical protein n=1 Tax=Paenibacillus polymyxa TaxID=1406 RepID=UPI000D8D356E|nr:hypothetical protein [Paenibacillus polymyxa]SPY17284.1 Uncharacterised protein [Paenibacillus polymyxa]
MDVRTSNIIYKYIIQLECTEQNKVYIKFLAKQLEFKYKVSMIFYHLLYTDSTWDWKKDVIFLRQIIKNTGIHEIVFDDHILEFVCRTIKDSNIGHRISSELIRWISKQINLNQLNEEILNRCLSESYMSFQKLLKFIYIFSENHYYPISFYEFDFNNVKAPYGRDWKIEFLEEMVQHPNLLNEKFFAEHLLIYCDKVSYSKDQFSIQDDFRVFLINPFFKLSEEQFSDLCNSNTFLRDGIINFLILQLSESEYGYFNKENLSRYFCSQVKRVINNENKSIKDYVSSLVKQANECKYTVVSVFKENEITTRLQSLL